VQNEESEQAQESRGERSRGDESLWSVRQGCYGWGSDPGKYKELMAIAVALTTLCPYCIEIHSNKAREIGDSDQAIAEVVMIAAALRAGAAITHGKHTIEGA